MSHSTRDAILALRKDKQAMDVFETAETEDSSAPSNRITTAQTYHNITAAHTRVSTHWRSTTTHNITSHPTHSAHPLSSSPVPPALRCPPLSGRQEEE